MYLELFSNHFLDQQRNPHGIENPVLVDTTQTKRDPPFSIQILHLGEAVDWIGQNIVNNKNNQINRVIISTLEKILEIR